jgi:hypothetical protein
VSNLFDNEISKRHPLAVSMFTAAVKRDRLAHAYLLTGRSVEDKWTIACQLASFLNCSQVADWSKDAACRVLHPADLCVNCRWIAAAKHPQAWLSLGSEGSKSGKVPVEKARELSEELAKCSQYFRTVIIQDAAQEKFHRPAANALLKTIENPGKSCLFLLFADREEEVLPTVVSRCQIVPLQNTGFQTTSFWSALNKIDEPSVSTQLEPLRQSFERVFSARDSRETSRALEFSKDMQTVQAELEDTCQSIDFAVNLEVARVGKRAINDKLAAGYLADLLWLAEEAKLHIEQYVSAKAAIETFVLSWWQLRKTAKC